MSQAELARPRQVYTVSELLTGVRHLLEDRVGRVWVAGEVSNFFRAASGHAYFSLVDDAGGQLKVALFRAAARALPFEIENGLDVLAYGDVSLYPARSELQLVARTLEPRGQGALQLALEQLRRRLEAEGLFDPGRKRALPVWPRGVGVVTSPVGAALRDVVHVTGRRLPGVPLLVAPTRVQGDGAEAEIAAALDLLSWRDDIDVVLLVRGGGSFEDLWAFQSERVVRAIAACRHPVVSGVGHETDFSLADAAADARGATPSAAAALVLPDRVAWRREASAARSRLDAAARGRLARARARLEAGATALRRLSPASRLAAQRRHFELVGRRWARLARELLVPPRERLARDRGRLHAAVPGLELLAARQRGLERQLAAAGERLVGGRRARLSELAGALDALSPLAVLGRGYALVRRESDGALVREASDAPAGERLVLRVARAEIRARSEGGRSLPGTGQDPKSP